MLMVYKYGNEKRQWDLSCSTFALMVNKKATDFVAFNLIILK
jgi:hypothetical protein